ncbi:hypothetical protein HMPREF0501_00487 [Limosilactobacillus coleohominis 101-4-CHN]|uniref:Uncharacterized protein n=1 Tax=Limosilactobacillus coleohominis 101-4-CHN TaxID=575594 RepID=C7XUX1_9LACO|nr:hypothetical protein [Limosilactobacillus coleohominis]EEU31082.1 hypothetical protein HMPREF0501_00487 [Limosilactobacillus coleohominis 101-4-CHN]
MELKDYRINPMDFAIACVQSSSDKITVEEKLRVYKKAYEEATKFADQIQKELN